MILSIFLSIQHPAFFNVSYRNVWCMVGWCVKDKMTVKRQMDRFALNKENDSVFFYLRISVLTIVGFEEDGHQLPSTASSPARSKFTRAIYLSLA